MKTKNGTRTALKPSSADAASPDGHARCAAELSQKIIWLTVWYATTTVKANLHTSTQT
jgi:hypothetical protein